MIDKQEIVRLIQIEKKIQESVSKLYGCYRSTIKKILKNKDLWKSIDQKIRKMKKVRSSSFDDLEKALFLWLFRRANSKSVTGMRIFLDKNFKGESEVFESYENEEVKSIICKNSKV